MLYTNFNDCGACGIYIITNLINNRIYVGQTQRKFIDRWKDHIRVLKRLDTVTKKSPLLQAFQKCGLENFDFKVLEYCDKELLDNREQFWICQLGANTNQNYNQTAGGQNQNLKATQPKWVNFLIKDLNETTLSLNQLAKKYNCSYGTIYDINSGKHYYNKEINYPIRILKQSKLLLICEDLKTTNLSLKALAKKYNYSLSTIKRINRGLGIYYLVNENYPLRKYDIEAQTADTNNIINLLQNSDLTFEEIAKITNRTLSSVKKINQGIRGFKENLNYPLRKEK